MSSTASLASHLWQVEYPESDGKPMAETDVHRRELMHAILTLQEHFKAEEDVYIAGNLLLYYEEGNPLASVAPDVFYVKGIPRGDRRTYKLWEEQVAPQVVIEFSSRSTRREDLGKKRDLYWKLGVEEYFLMDPLEEYLKPALQGFRRGEFGYLRLVPDKDGRLLSQVWGLWLRRDGEALRLVEADTGRVLPTPIEQAARAEQEAARAEQEAARAEQEAARAEQAVARAEQAVARAAQEATLRRQEAALRKQETARAEQEAALRKQETARAAQAGARAEREAKARQEMEVVLEKANAEALRLQALLEQAGIRSH